MEKYKSIWISDLHLGTRGCKADQLCQFLKMYDCDNLYLVGDILDGWKLSNGWYWPQQHSNVIRRILTKAKRGTNVFYIIGNHDEFLRPWLKHKLDIGNIQMSNKLVYTDVKGRLWYITHGDLFDQVTRNWKWVSILGSKAYSLLLMSNGLIHRIRKIFGLEYWSFSQYIKGKTKQALNFIYHFEDHLSTHAKNKNVHGIICGHIHTPALKEINGIMYANTGDWVESCSALVETMDGEFKLLILNSTGAMETIKVY